MITCFSSRQRRGVNHDTPVGGASGENDFEKNFNDAILCMNEKDEKAI